MAEPAPEPPPSPRNLPKPPTVKPSSLGRSPKPKAPSLSNPDKYEKWKDNIQQDFVKLPEHMGGYEVIHVQIKDPVSGKRVGIGQFRPVGDRELYPDSIHTEMGYRRQGVATAIYQHLMNQGYTIVKQQGLTRDGAKFRAKVSGEAEV